MKLVEKYLNDKGSLSLGEKKQLLDEAKDAYYNTGTELLSDSEYDSLEKSIGYENKSYIGSKHSGNYTIRHPFIMGSLSKVQIHQAKDGSIDWSTYLGEVKSYVEHFGPVKCIVTPKYDGCSFELYIDCKTGNVTYSGRGDGEYGKDIKNQLSLSLDEHFIHDVVDSLDDDVKKVCLRGEVLVSKTVFKEKYADEFANPRAFVAGMLNRKEEYLDEYTDLCPIIYDFRVEKQIVNNVSWIDHDWTFLKDSLLNAGHNYSYLFPNFYKYNISIDTVYDLVKIYNEFDEYRHASEYAQDGIVLKPIARLRLNNMTERRPIDCVAIKYTPMTEPTTVVDIEWKLGKTGEYVPTIVTEPVSMDGKKITRASAFNYGYLLEKKISVGTKVILSLAGDIIPFIYKIEDNSKFDSNLLGSNYPSNSFVSGIHLYVGKVPVEHKLLHTTLALNIPGFKEASIKKFIEWKKKDCEGDEFFGIESKPLPEHILLCTPNEINIALQGKIGESVSKAYSKLLKYMSLKDIIMSCNFKLCGDKVATQIANKIIGEDYDFTSMASEAYDWIDDKNSEQWKLLQKIFDFNGWSLDNWKLSDEDKKHIEEEKKKVADQIPVILTGEPNDYASKNEFLKCHPEYRMTGSWKEVKIVFTNSLESNTGKMKKAKEKNIEIRTY